MKRLSRHKRKIALIALVLVIVGVVLALRTRAAWEEACTLARRSLPALLGMEVGIGRCELDPARKTVRLFGVSAFQPGSTEPVFSADSAEARFGLWQPFFGPVAIDAIEVQRPRFNVDLSAPSGTPRRGGACPLDALKQVRVEQLQLKGAEVRLRLPAGGWVELGGVELGWTMRRGQAELELDAKEGVWTLGAERGALSVSQLALEASLDPDDGTLEVARAELGLDDVTLSLSGKVEQLCDPSLLLDGQLYVPLRTVAKAAGLRQEVKGHLWSGVSVSGRGVAPSVTFEVVASGLGIGRYQPGDFTARLSLAKEELTLTELRLPAGEGSVRVSGTLGLKGNLLANARVDVEDAQLGPLLAKAGMPGAWVDVRLTGRGTLKGNLLPSPQLLGEGDFRTARFSLATRPYDAPATQGRTLLVFDQGRISGVARVLADRADFSDVEITTPGGSRVLADGTLHYEPAKGLRLAGRADSLVLSDFGNIAGLPWNGTGQATFSATGPYRNVKIDANVGLRDFDLWDFSLGNLQGHAAFADDVLRFDNLTGLRGRTTYTGSAALDFTGPTLHAYGDVDVPRGGRAEDLIDAIVRLHSSLELFQGPMDGEAHGRVKIDSLDGRLSGKVELGLAKLRYYERRLGDGQLVLAFRRETGGESLLNGETLDLEELRLTGPVGELTGHGRWSFDGPLDFRFRGGRLSLAELVGPERAQRLGISGTLNFDGRVDGDDTVPIVTLALTSPRITFAERSLGEMLLNGKVAGREMQVWGKPFTDAYASMKMTLKGQVPYDATVTLKLPEIRPLLSAGAISQGVSGVLEGVLHAKGDAREPTATTRADATLTRLTLSRGDFTAENDGDLELRYADKRLDVTSFALRGPNTRLGVSGWVDPERLDVKLEGGLDMRLFESFLPVLERTGGQLQLDANAHGRLDAPSLVGSAKLRDVRLAIKDKAVAARGLVGEVEFSERGVVLQELRGILNDGRVSVRGEVKMDRFVPRTVKVDAQLDEVAFRPTEDLPLTASGQLTLEGKPDALVLTGGLDVLKLRYERPLELETLLRSAGAARATIATESAKTGKDWVRFGVTVRLGDVRVENNLARARLLGELKLVGTNARPGLLGTVETGPGSQAFFRGNRFTVTQGVIEFKDEKSIDPTFDLRAETQVREYLVRLHAYGRPADPKLALTSEPELVEGDVISLLTLGVISSDRNSTASASAGLATEALLNVSGLDREVQRFLPKNAVLRDLSFHVATTYNEASGLVEPAAQLESKFLTEQLKLGMTRPVSGRGTRAQAEYRFTNGLSAQAQWDNDQRDTSSSSSIGNLGLDLKLRWEVE